MSDQIQKMVDSGELLNYDSCFQNETIANLASKQPVLNDDVNMSQSKDRLCRIYYNNSFWRGGINNTIDDRVTNNVVNIWNKQIADKSKSVINIINENFSNQLNQARQFIIAYNLYGQERDFSKIQDIKNDVESSILSIVNERKKIETLLNTLKKENSDSLLQEVKDNEEKIRNLKNDNDKHRLTNELRREQTKDLYERYNSNFHSSPFGYAPISSSNQSPIMFTSILMGIIGLVSAGLQISQFINNPSTIIQSQVKQSQIVKKVNARY